VQVALIPIPNSKMAEEAKASMAARVASIEAVLRGVGVRLTCDTRENYTPGFKYNYWELKVLWTHGGGGVILGRVWGKAWGMA
jgi:hypothetical protein